MIDEEAQDTKIAGNQKGRNEHRMEGRKCEKARGGGEVETPRVQCESQGSRGSTCGPIFISGRCTVQAWQCFAYD